MDHPGDLDGVVLTGYSHESPPEYSELALPLIYPANFDPLFAGQFPNMDYLTLVPGGRSQLFFHEPATSPQVIALDNGMRDVIAVGELSVVPLIPSPRSLAIDVPVFIILGDQDLPFCGPGTGYCASEDALLSFEEDFFSDAACLEVELVEGVGHNLQLHRKAGSITSQILNWVNRRVGRDPGAASQACD